MKNNILIIAKAVVNKGVFKSHVYNFSQNLNEKVGIVSLNSKKNISLLDETYYSEINNSLDFGWTVSNSADVFFPSFYKKINDKIRNQNINILYCQNYLPSFLGIIMKLFNKNLKVHADIKGIVPEEHLLYDNGLKKYVIYIFAKIMEFFIFSYADSYSVVSHEFKKYFEKKYSLNNKQILVLPSSLDHKNFYFDQTIRNSLRNKKGWTDNNVLVYCGSMVERQLPKKLFTTMKNISDNNENIIPLILTLDTKKAHAMKDVLGFEKLIIISCNGSSEVNAYLNAADTAIIIRKDDIVNNVSSPTKIAEYLYTKNKLILSKGIGDYSSLSNDYKGIYNINNIENIQISEIFSFIKEGEFDEGIIDLIRNEYTQEANIEKIKELFNSY